MSSSVNNKHEKKYGTFTILKSSRSARIRTRIATFGWIRIRIKQMQILNTGPTKASRKADSSLPNKVIPVVLRQGHECSAHDDELHLVHTVAQLL